MSLYICLESCILLVLNFCIQYNKIKVKTWNTNISDTTPSQEYYGVSRSSVQDNNARISIADSLVLIFWRTSSNIYCCLSCMYGWMDGCMHECNCHAMPLPLTNQKSSLYPPHQRSWKGGILVSPCPSVRPSVCLSVCPSVDRIVSALYLQQYSSDPFHICTSYQATLEGVSRIMPVSKFKNLKFLLCLLLTWDPIWLNGMGNHEAAGCILRTQAF